MATAYRQNRWPEVMSKPRLLIPISLQFSVRYLLRTGLLNRLGQMAQPVILLGWEDPELKQELEEEGCEVHSLLKSQWGTSYTRARMLVNLWYHRQLASPSLAIRERRSNLDRSLHQRARQTIHATVRRAILSVPGSPARARRTEAELFFKDTNAREVDTQIHCLRPDALFCLTPFLLDEEMTARVCARRQIPSSTAILSFDNLTTRSWIPTVFQQYLLWNRHNVEQLRRGYPESSESQVEIVGSPQFDFYRDTKYLWPENEWRRNLGLTAGRPVILFGGGFYGCAPHEPQFLQQLDQAIEQKTIPGDPIILFRRHPVDPIERWKPVLEGASHVVHDDPWKLGRDVLGHANVRHEDIAKLASSLYHCNVHVNVASSMSVDGAIMDRPQVGPAYDASPGRKYDRAAKECYLQEHFLPIYHSGGIDIVNSSKEMASAIRSAFENPDRAKTGRQRIVEEICTFNDGKSTARVAAQLALFLKHSTVPAELVAADTR
jgi:hypothetical protein